MKRNEKLLSSVRRIFVAYLLTIEIITAVYIWISGVNKLPQGTAREGTLFTIVIVLTVICFIWMLTHIYKTLNSSKQDELESESRKTYKKNLKK